MFVEPAFTEGGPGSTDVVVRHSAGRMPAPGWAAMRGDFERGFSAVIRAFAGAVCKQGEMP